MKTRSIRAEDVRRDWFVVDAADRTLGRMATAIADRLRGKHKAEYTPNADTGDFVIVINAERVKVTGKKGTDKIYVRHTGFPGGIRNTPFNRMRETHPERIIEKAVKGMLPRNPLGRQMFRKLKVYAGPKHPHSAQQPRELAL